MTTSAIVAENFPSPARPTVENKPVKVIHVITDLDVGGAERMLVSYLTAKRDAAPNSFAVSLLSGGYFAKWLSEAGLPDGVFNVIQGDKIAVDGLLMHY